MIEEANCYLSRSNSMMKAFHRTLQKYPDSVQDLADRRPLRSLSDITRDLFFTGVAYLANRCDDEYLQKIGTVGWRSMQQGRAAIIITNQAALVAAQLGIHDEDQPYYDDGHPSMVIGARRNGFNIEEEAVIILTPDFAFTARARPVEALADTATICSMLTDFASLRYTSDSDAAFRNRAEASMTHVLVEAVRRHPYLVLAPYFRSKLSQFPYGINSLAQKERYKINLTGKEPLQAAFN